LILFYAAKIAAAELHAPRHELTAIIAAIRAEQKSALNALKERRDFEAQAKRRTKLAWRIATAPVMRRKARPMNPRRPRRLRGRFRTPQPQRR
jgi:hypothetical protein